MPIFNSTIMGQTSPNVARAHTIGQKAMTTETCAMKGNKLHSTAPYTVPWLNGRSYDQMGKPVNSPSVNTLQGKGSMGTSVSRHLSKLETGRNNQKFNTVPSPNVPHPRSTPPTQEEMKKLVQKLLDQCRDRTINREASHEHSVSPVGDRRKNVRYNPADRRSPYTPARRTPRKANTPSFAQRFRYQPQDVSNKPENQANLTNLKGCTPSSGAVPKHSSSYYNKDRLSDQGKNTNPNGTPFLGAGRASQSRSINARRHRRARLSK